MLSFKVQFNLFRIQLVFLCSENPKSFCDMQRLSNYFETSLIKATIKRVTPLSAYRKYSGCGQYRKED